MSTVVLGEARRSALWRWIARNGMLLVVALVAGLATVARQQGVPRYRTIWAEDGAVFAQCAYSDSLLRCLATPYDAWIHVMPRVLASVATAFPPVTLSYALTALAALVTIAAAALVARAVADIGATGPAAVVAGASLALVYSAGIEVGGNITNLHWIVVAAGVAITSATWLEHRCDWVDAVFLFAVAASSPFGFLLAALAAVGAILRRPGLIPLTAGLTAIALGQLAVAVTATRIEVPDAVAGGSSPIPVYVDAVVRVGSFGGRGWIPDWLVTGGLGVVIVALVVVAVRRRDAPTETRTAEPQSFLRTRIIDLAAVVAIVASGAAIFLASLVLNHHIAARHAYVAAALTVIALLVGLARLVGNRTPRRTAERPPDGTLTRRLRTAIHAGAILQGGVALVIAIGFASTFRVHNSAGRGPNVPAEMQSARDRCATGASVVAITIAPLPAASTAPPAWHVEVPCARLGG